MTTLNEVRSEQCDGRAATNGEPRPSEFTPLSALRVRPFDPERDTRALELAAKSDAHAPLNPTHIIERDGEIVGYLGVNSLPLYRLWFHSEKLKATDSTKLLFMLENHYRMAGVPLVATVINTESPFYKVAERGGYLELAGDRLFLKPL